MAEGTVSGTNSLFGSSAGASNVSGTNLSFFGSQAGFTNLSGNSNSYFGRAAGAAIATGSGNSFFGDAAGFWNLVGDHNAYFGAGTGGNVVSANFNTLLGAQSNHANGLQFATAIGARARVEQSHAVVIGSIAGIEGATVSANVGIGVTQPATALHVKRADGTSKVLVEDSSADPVARTLFKLSSGGSNTKFEIDNNSAGVLWAFTNAGTDFRISRQGSGEVEFSVGNDGNAVLAGTLTQNSDVNAKQDIVAVDPDAVLAKVAALPVSTWAYKDSPQARHLGPMAQDFHAAFGLGATDTGISSIDTGGVALAAIQALNHKLESRNADLEARVQLLERMVSELLPRVAQD